MKAMSLEGWEKHFTSKGLRMTYEETFYEVIMGGPEESEWEPDGYYLIVYKGNEKYLEARSTDCTGESISPSEFRPLPKKKSYWLDGRY